MYILACKRSFFLMRGHIYKRTDANVFNVIRVSYTRSYALLTACSSWNLQQNVSYITTVFIPMTS